MSLAITVCYHLASLDMPNGDPRDGFFCPTLTLMMNSYSLYIIYITELFLANWIFDSHSLGHHTYFFFKKVTESVPGVKLRLKYLISIS